MSCSVVIVAAGEGARMGAPKQFIEIGGQPMCMRACEAFERSALVDEIIMVVAPDNLEPARELSKKCWFEKVKAVIAGGATRQESVRNGLKQISANSDLVLIHDGARPLVTKDLIENVISSLGKSDSVVPGVPVTDTVKELSNANVVVKTLKRGSLWAIQTPQGFRASTIRNAYEAAEVDGFAGTDDSMLVERLGGHVDVVMGSYDNIKVTTPFDLRLAECIIKNRDKRGADQ
jgi:2-C-methyl-D-erythritol 4-phosphate cytidylyltransferase